MSVAHQSLITTWQSWMHGASCRTTQVSTHLSSVSCHSPFWGHLAGSVPITSFFTSSCGWMAQHIAAKHVAQGESCRTAPTGTQRRLEPARWFAVPWTCSPSGLTSTANARASSEALSWRWSRRSACQEKRRLFATPDWGREKAVCHSILGPWLAKWLAAERGLCACDFSAWDCAYVEKQLAHPLPEKQEYQVYLCTSLAMPPSRFPQAALWVGGHRGILVRCAPAPHRLPPALRAAWGSPDCNWMPTSFHQ